VRAPGLSVAYHFTNWTECFYFLEKEYFMLEKVCLKDGIKNIKAYQGRCFLKIIFHFNVNLISLSGRNSF
jgi:hypothetical protein